MVGLNFCISNISSGTAWLFREWTTEELSEHFYFVTFFGETEHFSGKTGALRWSILVGKQSITYRTWSRASRKFWPTARDASSSNRRTYLKLRLGEQLGSLRNKTHCFHGANHQVIIVSLLPFWFAAQLILYLMKCFVYQLKGKQVRPVRRMVWKLKRFKPALNYGVCTPFKFFAWPD